MANPVKLFKKLREFYTIIGIHPVQLNDESYNLRNVVVLMFMTLNLISSGAVLINGVNNIRDYGGSFYAFMTELVHVGCFPSYRNKMTTIFELMDEYEAFIEKS